MLIAIPFPSSRPVKASLLRGLEQADRSAVAHHLYRVARVGTSVMSQGSWYKAVGPFVELGLIPA